MKRNIATLTILAIALFFALTAGMLVANQLQNNVTVEGHEAIGPYFLPDGLRLPDGQRLAIGPYFMPDGARSTARLA